MFFLKCIFKTTQLLLNPNAIIRNAWSPALKHTKKGWSSGVGMHFHILSCSSSHFNCSLSSVQEAQVQGSGTERLNSSHHFLSSQDAAVCCISSKTLLLSFFQSFNTSPYRTPIRILNIANATAGSHTATSSVSLY